MVLSISSFLWLTMPMEATPVQLENHMINISPCHIFEWIAGTIMFLTRLPWTPISIAVNTTTWNENRFSATFTNTVKFLGEDRTTTSSRETCWTNERTAYASRTEQASSSSDWSGLGRHLPWSSHRTNTRWVQHRFWFAPNNEIIAGASSKYI